MALINSIFLTYNMEKDIVDLFLETYEKDIEDYNSHIESTGADNYLELNDIIKSYCTDKNAKKAAEAIIKVCGPVMLKRNYFSDLPMDESSAIEFLAKEISNIHPNMLNVFGNLIKGLEMKIIRFVLIDDFKKINFNKLGTCWTDYSYRNDSWYEEHIVDSAENNYMEFVAHVPASACSLPETFFAAILYTTKNDNMREYEVKVKNQSKIKLISIRLKNNYDYV